MKYSIDYCCICDRGNIREKNQDNFVCGGAILPAANHGTPEPLTGSLPSGEGPLFGVFDGMGGEQEGEKAAFLAAQAASEAKFGGDPVKDLRGLCLEANRRVCDYAESHRVSSMGTTAAMVRFMDEGVYACNLGDSRIFRFHAGALRQISQDHVLPAPKSKKPPLLQYLGIPETELLLEPGLSFQRPDPGDRYLICSDGLTDMLTPEEIARCLEEPDVKAAAERLAREAMGAGGRDNLTVLLCRIRAEAAPPAEKKSFLGRWLERLRRGE